MEVMNRVETRDIALTQRIQNRIQFDRRISNADVHVLSKRGHVTLIGKVDSMAKKTAAAELAKNTKGVVSVVNQLEIPTVFTREDEELKNLIDTKIQELNFTGKEYISVEVNRGVVKLEGTVLSKTKKASASALTWELSGVRDCINMIKIDDGVRPYEFTSIELRPTVEANRSPEVIAV